MINVAINGFGRIGRSLAAILLESDELNLVAINDLADPATLAHLFKYDSIHPRKVSVEYESGTYHFNSQRIKALQQQAVENLPWEELGIDLVFECTGKIKSKTNILSHIKAGAKKVLLSSPPLENDDIKTIVLGVNDDLVSSNDIVLSNASCTTNSAAHLIQNINDLCDIESAYITTVHSYTGDQTLHDTPHKDLRRARAAATSIIPTTTGAAKALTRIFPELNDKIGGCGIRVPVPDGSLTDITCVVKKPISIEEINSSFLAKSALEWKGLLEYTTDPIVSVDVIGNPHSVVFDSLLTSVIGNMVKVVGWYDNEIGYSYRLVDLAKLWFRKR